MSVIIKIGSWFLNFIYMLMKLLPVQKKITYISRQMNTTPKDFQMVIDNFKAKDNTYKHVVLSKMIPKGIVGKVEYCFHMLKQMYHIVTSQAVLLDTYCIPISLLKQRKRLIVIQMWHALGAFKKFGYSILDQEEGSSSKIAYLMKMHHNYTYVLSSSQYASQFFAEAFHVENDKMKVFPLPKTDLLIDKELKKETIHRIYQKYPQLKNTQKKVIVYAPTFRKNNDQELYHAIMKFIQQIDFHQYEFVLKIHPLTQFHIDHPNIIEDHNFTSLEFFHLADYIVTDYSAILFEAVMLDKPVYFYAFDYQEYMGNRSFYIDYQTQIPGPIFKDSKELMDAIAKGKVDKQKIQDFKRLMIAPCQKSYTDDFTDFLMKEIDQ